MPHYEFSAQAERDLEGIVDYTLEHWGSRQAVDYLIGLEDLAQNLAENSGLGIRRDELIDGLISFPYGSHNLFYIKQAHGITIIRVLHKHMDPMRHINP